MKVYKPKKKINTNLIYLKIKVELIYKILKIRNKSLIMNY